MDSKEFTWADRVNPCTICCKGKGYSLLLISDCIHFYIIRSRGCENVNCWYLCSIIRLQYDENNVNGPAGDGTSPRSSDPVSAHQVRPVGSTDAPDQGGGINHNAKQQSKASNIQVSSTSSCEQSLIDLC